MFQQKDFTIHFTSTFSYLVKGVLRGTEKDGSIAIACMHNSNLKRNILDFTPSLQVSRTQAKYRFSLNSFLGPRVPH